MFRAKIASKVPLARSLFARERLIQPMDFLRVFSRRCHKRIPHRCNHVSAFLRFVSCADAQSDHDFYLYPARLRKQFLILALARNNQISFISFFRKSKIYYVEV
jgi:hypothetical protein